MREIRSYGSVRGVAGDRYPYRDFLTLILHLSQEKAQSNPTQSDTFRHLLSISLSTPSRATCRYLTQNQSDTRFCWLSWR